MVYDRFSSRFYVTFHSIDELLTRIDKPKQQIGFSHGNNFHT
jgi:hypothetical protein